MGGNVTVKSQPGVGTSFFVTICTTMIADQDLLQKLYKKKKLSSQTQPKVLSTYSSCSLSSEKESMRPAETKVEALAAGCLPANLKVMLINDEFTQLFALEHHIRRVFNGINVVTFTGENGSMALQEVQKNIQSIVTSERRQLKLRRQQSRLDDSNAESIEQCDDVKHIPTHYNLIVLDLNMPVMGGKEACQKIVSAYKSFNQLQHDAIPFISLPKLKRAGSEKCVLLPSKMWRLK